MENENSWRVAQNTGKRATIVRGSERREIQRPAGMTLKEFVQALPHGSMVSDSDLATRIPNAGAPPQRQTA